MTPNEIYALNDLDEKPWYAFEKNKHILNRLFPVLLDLPVDFDRVKTDGNNRFSLCLKIRTPSRPGAYYTWWALMFDGRPFGFFTAWEYFSGRSFNASIDMNDSQVYITDLTLWQTAEDLVCSYVNESISQKPSFNLPVLAGDQTLNFKSDFLAPAFIEGMALVAPIYHRTEYEIVAFNVLIYHRLLNELIEREGEEKLNQMKWTSRSFIVKEMARIVLLSVPKGIEARVGSGTVKNLYDGRRQRVLAILRFDSGTYGLTIEAGARLHDYQDSDSIKIVWLGEPDAFGSAHERVKWVGEDPRRV